jgi:hypothetical protein
LELNLDAPVRLSRQTPEPSWHQEGAYRLESSVLTENSGKEKGVTV